MQGSLVSARLIFTLLVALFSAGEQEKGVLVDRIVAGGALERYLAVAEAQGVAILELRAGEPPAAISTLRRAPGASHLFVELEGERVYSLEQFYAQEFRLLESAEVTLELPRYPEAMVERASMGRAGSDEQEEGSNGESPSSADVSALPGSDVREAVPAEPWLFRRSGTLLYIQPAGGTETLVVRPVP